MRKSKPRSSRSGAGGPPRAGRRGAGLPRDRDGAVDSLARDGIDEVAAPVPPLRVPIVAIVGRPNVGKSTLYNRLARTQAAIVDAQPGVTRDRNIAPAQWGDRRILLVDTGGYEDVDRSAVAAAVREQSALASEEADAVIALFDGRAGLNPVDREFVQRLRGLGKPVFFAANKLDTGRLEDEAAEFYALGVGEVFPISAAHGVGVGELMDRVLAALPEDGGGAVAAAPGAVRLAIVGRPNVGKSSLLNRLVGFERSIVDATPGTTRDAIDTPFRCGERDYVLVDTAGIRRRPRVHEVVERASAVRALRALERAEAALVVLDAAAGITEQDARIAGYAWERGRAALLVINKWDAVPRAQRDRGTFARGIRERYPTLAALPTVFVSARTGVYLDELFPALERLVVAHRQRLRTVELNRVLESAAAQAAPPSVRGRRPRFYYATQTRTAPPTITVFTSNPALVQPVYERYLLNTFRAAFALDGVPLRLRFVKSRGNREASGDV